MKHKDRFFATILYEPVDRPATWLGMPVPAAEQGLRKYFRVRSVHELKKKIDDDV
jgi:uroporphyrinogen decarboxylase